MTLYRLFTIWLARRLGVHACEDFTPWKDCKTEHVRRTTAESDLPYFMHNSYVTVIGLWQERHCLVCGKVERSEVTRRLYYKE